MTWSLQKILQVKRARRRELASLPIAEKLRLLDAGAGAGETRGHEVVSERAKHHPGLRGAGARRLLGDEHRVKRKVDVVVRAADLLLPQDSSGSESLEVLAGR